MLKGASDEREPVDTLLARLVEDGRALVKAELALARTDFYRRLGRAKMGAVLLLFGAMMSQAAVVTFLVTLSFVLERWLTRPGAAALSVLLGLGIAYATIRMGVRKLISVFEDPDEPEDGRGNRRSAIDQIFEEMREKSREARDQVAHSLDQAQARLHPRLLIADFTERFADQAQAAAHDMMNAARRRPLRTASAILAVLLLVVRPPVHRLFRQQRGATRPVPASFRNEAANPSADRFDEEFPS